jgi:hypothetical protein
VLDRGSVSALSESNSKSACAFPIISSAVRVLASSRSARSARARNRTVSTWSEFRRRALGATSNPASAPMSRARQIHHVRGVQPLPAQNSALLARLGRVVLGQHGQLVLSGENPADRAISSRAHRAIIGGQGRQVRSRHRQGGLPVSPCAEGGVATGGVSPQPDAQGTRSLARLRAAVIQQVGAYGPALTGSAVGAGAARNEGRVRRSELGRRHQRHFVGAAAPPKGRLDRGHLSHRRAAADDGEAEPPFGVTLRDEGGGTAESEGGPLAQQLRESGRSTTLDE